MSCSRLTRLARPDDCAFQVTVDPSTTIRWRLATWRKRWSAQRRRCIVVAAGLIGAAHGCVALATTYYVSQSKGSDGNAGTLATAPWKSVPGMASFTGAGRLVAGDVVYFDRGDTWLVTGTQGIYLVGGVTYVGDAWGNGTRATLRSPGAAA